MLPALVANYSAGQQFLSPQSVRGDLRLQENSITDITVQESSTAQCSNTMFH